MRELEAVTARDLARGAIPVSAPPGNEEGASRGEEKGKA